MQIRNDPKVETDFPGFYTGDNKLEDFERRYAMVFAIKDLK